MRKYIALLLLPWLGGCDEPVPSAQPMTPELSAQLSPADPRLAELYAGSWKACHTVKDSLAPLTVDRSPWDARWAQGEAALLSASIQGKNGMPAGGQCFTCTPEDLKKLIRFMAGREDEQ